MKLVIIMPVLDDWVSCRMLLGQLDDLEFDVERLRVLIVNDGSVNTAPSDICAMMDRGNIAAVDVVDLGCNVGHQRAIALGIAAVALSDAGEYVVVMDSDGEDAPSDVSRLVAALKVRPDGLVVAVRTRRSEGQLFKVGYWAYQSLFRIVVGQRIDFGNFCAFGPAAAVRLARMPDVWNHLAGAALRSRLPIVRVPTRRGPRLAGRSSMNSAALIAHGLSALSVFSERVFARLLIFAAALGSIALVGLCVVVAIRFGTNWAIPGWATIAFAGFSILLMQAILVSLVAAVQLLSTRSQSGAVPLVLFPTYADKTRSMPMRSAASGSSGTADEV